MELSESEPLLLKEMGAFVTLNKHGELRGCIGNTDADESLMLAVRDNTISASKDPRFDPLDRNELKNIKIGTNGGTTLINITAQQIEVPELVRGMIILVFSDVPGTPERAQNGPETLKRRSSIRVLSSPQARSRSSRHGSR